MLARSVPIDLVLPSHGIAVAESIHADDFAMSWRSDPYCKLLFIVRGQTRLEVRGREPVTLRSGDAAAVASDIAHRLADLEPTTVVVLALANAYVDAIAARRATWTIVRDSGAQPLDAATRVTVTTRLRSILHMHRSPPDGLDARSELLLRSRTDEILAALAANDPGHHHRASRDRVARLLDEIADAPFAEWTTEQAATSAGLSVRRFADLQREKTGTPFQKWLTTVRARYSARLIAEEGYTVSTAAFAAGFSSLPTFYRAFRREMGCPPGDFAKRSE
jgi:AraC-like DNA-binding protein